MSNICTRWAAVGAAVAVTLGAGGIGLVGATSPADATAYQPITPCRIADTRSNPDVNVGDKSSPLGPEETHAIAAHGTNGECTDIPKTATGLQLNVTALNATAPTFVTVSRVGDQPNASSLNPVPGQPPAPNAVTTGLTTAGEFKVFNKFGFVDVIVDIVGLYTDHDHDDRYYTKSRIDRERPFVVSSESPPIALSAGGPGAPLETVADVAIDVPANGHVTVHSHAVAQLSDSSINCLLLADSEPDPPLTQFTPGLQSASNVTTLGMLNGLRLFEVDGRSQLTVELRCIDASGTGAVQSSRLVAMYTPDAD